MKAKDLLRPFFWKNRKILMQDCIWYLPERTSASGESLLSSWSEFFHREAPLSIEFCSGNGDWIVQKAMEEPQRNWLAVEKRFDRVRKIWSKMKNQSLQNLRIVCGDARSASALFFPSSSVEEVYIHFPDPWPKRRHAKHRILSDDFLHAMDRILLPRARLVFVTDDESCRDRALDSLFKHRAFQAKTSSPFYLKKADMQFYGESYFSKLWLALDRNIYLLHFEKNDKKNTIGKEK